MYCFGTSHENQSDLPETDVQPRLSEKYGDVFTVQFGPKKIVVLAGYKTAKEALVNQGDDFGKRAEMPIFTKIMKSYGLVFSNGESWKVMKRFTLLTLQDFGMGKKTIESRIQDELNPLLEHFNSHNGKAFEAFVILNTAVSNVFCSIIFGNRFEYDDPTLQTLINLLNENTQLAGTPLAQLYNSYPTLGALLGADKPMIRNLDKVNKVMKNFIQNHRQEFNASNITGYIDAFLMKQEQVRRRACMGESLAKMELFLFFTGLLQRFTFHPPTGTSKEDLDLTGEGGFVLQPKPYKLCAVPNY
ncbi:cytochrome P450 2K4-like [Discoglossus pictus]